MSVKSRNEIVPNSEKSFLPCELPLSIFIIVVIRPEILIVAPVRNRSCQVECLALGGCKAPRHHCLCLINQVLQSTSYNRKYFCVAGIGGSKNQSPIRRKCHDVNRRATREFTDCVFCR